MPVSILLFMEDLNTFNSFLNCTIITSSPIFIVYRSIFERMKHLRYSSRPWSFWQLLWSYMMETISSLVLGVDRRLIFLPGICRTSGRSRHQGCRHRCFFSCTTGSRGVVMLASSSCFWYCVLFRTSGGGYAGHHGERATVVIRRTRQDVVADNAGAAPKLFGCDFQMTKTTW